MAAYEPTAPRDLPVRPYRGGDTRHTGLTVWEPHDANPTMGRRALYRAGIRIGRDHIASVVYTLGTILYWIGPIGPGGFVCNPFG